MAKSWVYLYRCECSSDDCFLKIPEKEYEFGRLLKSTKGIVYIQNPNCSSSLMTDEKMIFESDTFDLILVPFEFEEEKEDANLN